MTLAPFFTFSIANPMKRLIPLLLCASLCQAASVTIAESAYTDASGRLATGTITVTGPSFSNGTSYISATNKTVPVTNGVFSISLEPNDTADPPFNYTASFRLSIASPYSQQWKVKTAAGPLGLQDVVWSSNSPVTVGLDQFRRTGYFAGDIGYYNGTLWVRLPRGTNGQSLTIDTSLSGYLKWATISGSGGGTWGSITGTLSDQTDLGTALTAKLVKASNLSDLASASTARTNLGLGTAAVSAASAFAATVHAHAASDVTSGVFDIARLATGTPNGAKFVRDDGVLATPAGGGDVSGPSSATDNCLARFDGATGKTIQNSTVCADDSGGLTAASLSTGDGTIAGEPKMYELSANGNEYRSWVVPDYLTAIMRMKFPDAVPAAGQVLTFGVPDGTTKISQMAFATLRHQLVGVGGSSQTARGRINLIAGTNVTLTPSDNSGSDSLDLTIAASGGGGGLPSDTGHGKQMLSTDGSGAAAWKPVLYYHPWSTGTCNNTTASGAGVNFDATNGASATTCTGNGNKYLFFSSTAGSTTTLYILVPLPSKFISGSTATLTIRYESAATGGTTPFSVQSTCDAQTTATFNSASTVSATNNGTAFLQATATLSAIDMTGCSGNDIATFKITRTSASASDTFFLGGGMVTLSVDAY